MTAASLHALQTVLEQAERDRDAAVSALRQAERLAAHHDDQARRLQSYQTQFEARWTAQFRQPTASTLLRCHHGFSHRLDEAIVQQRGQCQLQDQRVARARDHWLRCEQRVAAVRKLIERRQLARQQMLNQSDQKQTDEAAQRAAWANAPSTDLS